MIEFTISNTLLFLKLPFSVKLLPIKCSTARLNCNSSILQKKKKQSIAGGFMASYVLWVGFAGKTHSTALVWLVVLVAVFCGSILEVPTFIWLINIHFLPL